MVSHKKKKVDLAVLSRRAMEQEDFRTGFGLDIIEEARAAKRAGLPHRKNIEDLSNLYWTSIDNTESKDLDQLEFSEPLGEGRSRLMVAIADVDSFVPHASASDDRAAHNTTSVYTGIVVYPMLYEEFSENLTSLIEGERRLAIVADLVIARDGVVESAHFKQAIVRNHFKLAYSQVGKWFTGDAANPSKKGTTEALEDQLELQVRQAGALEGLRFRSGALNLETIEARPVTDKGRVIDLVVTEQNPARELIENFMIAVNCSMTKFLFSKGIVCIRRVVRVPKRWPRIVEVAEQFGEKLPEKPDNKALSQFLEQQRALDPERFPDLSLTIVKLLGRGEYTVVRPGEESASGHFGLGLHDYAHSTAPNRRYADLIMQRQLKAVLNSRPQPYSEDDLRILAGRCSERESASNRVERYMRKAAAAVLLSDNIGEDFEAIVTGVKGDGTYIRLVKPAAEGRIVQNERGLDVGDKVFVRLLSTDPEKGFIDFKRI